MDKLIIEGGQPLVGEVRISGAKNAALPLMCAALLSAEPLTLSNVPHLRDVTTMLRLLSQMGVGASLDDRDGLQLEATVISEPLAAYDLVKTMRASILVLGPLLARCGEARVSLPGGCAIGTRPEPPSSKMPPGNPRWWTWPIVSTAWAPGSGARAAT